MSLQITQSSWGFVVIGTLFVLLMAGSFLRRTIQKGSKTTTAMLLHLSAEKKAASWSTSVKSVVNVRTVNWPTVTVCERSSPKWPSSIENVILTLISWHRSILCLKKITKKLSPSIWTKAMKPDFLKSFFLGTGGIWVSLKTSCAESTVTIPFWDWSKNIHHWWRGTENDDLWNPEDHGLGGDGSKLDNHCVENGPFSKDKWSLLDVSGGGCLTRNFLKRSLVHDTENVNKTLSLPLEKFNEFEETLRSDYHIEPHFVFGGTMNNPLISANSPELLLHHAFLDKLWYEWQTKGNEYQNVYFPNVPLKFHGSKYYCWEWIDSSNLPGEVKVVYEEWSWV